MQQILNTYKKRLINISANNRSLLLRRLLKEQFIDLHDFDFANSQPSFELIKELIARKSRVKLCKIVDSRDESINILSKRLRRLSRREKMLYEEHGSKDLYVGWPFVAGKFSDGTSVRCPLIFFPVEIQQDDKGWYLKQREDVNITLNKAFLVAYGHYNEVKISEEVLERVFDDFDTDSMVFRTGLYHLFKDSPVEINFNQDNFADRLDVFREYTKQEFDDEKKTGELKLYPEAVLGIFPQSGSYLVPDYDYISEHQNFAELGDFFEAKIPQNLPGDRYGFLSRVKEEETYTPFKMDAYQENAIKAVKQGTSVVIQGPPGTGKSQVICNLIADYIARGKKVLVVCQKRAALDVVYQRFEELEMNEFLGLIHDFKNDRKELYEKIDKQIKSIEQYKLNINSLDALQLERKFVQHSRKIDQITEELEEFKSALFDENECGLSVKELYLTSKISGQLLNVKQEYKHFSFSDISESYSRIRNYVAYARKLAKPDYPLLERKSFAGSNITALRRMQEHLDKIDALHHEVATATLAIAGSEIVLEDCLTILDRKEVMKEFLSIIKSEDVYTHFQSLMGSKTSEEDLAWFEDHAELILKSFKDEGIEKSLKHEELGDFQKSLNNAIRAKRDLLKFFQWRFFSKDREKVIKVLNKNKLPVSRKGLASLIKMIDNRLNLEHNLTLIEDKKWVQPYNGKLTRVGLTKWVDNIKAAFRAKILFTSFRNFTEYFATQQLNAEELNEKIEELYRQINHIPEAWSSWQIYFTDSQLRKLTTDQAWFNYFRTALDRDFESLCEFDNLKLEIPAHEEAIVTRALEEDKKGDPDAILAYIDNNLRLQWIEHIETKYPILRSVSSLKFPQLEKELQENVRGKLKISQEILALRIKEQTYADVEYNRLNNMITYRELAHQVTKQRRVWPLRKLISQFSEEIYHLIPCWLASPETVSAVFPMDEAFDLVIFDEASQCFTERGIPAMYRGKQLVVAGDSKQLRPNDLYQIRVEEDIDDVALEVDSLLELANQYLMDVQLQGHYRSSKPELIEFSNTNFYDGTLRLLPDRDMVNNTEAAIEYIKVDGIWENQQNLVEAEKVIALVVKLTTDSPEKSIGIVTFNARQQDLIMDLLDDYESENNFLRPKSLIVKNIENIQGDEKDVIIFSTAYAPDKNGKIVMQFGSLSIVGGENRLNVAITRAKEKIYIITSIAPQQLKVDSLKNDGPKLLRAYMEYAREVSNGQYSPVKIQPKRSNADWYLKNRIQDWLVNDIHCKADSELSFADITVSNNENYLGVIATDDDLYFQSPSIKDIHVYTPFTLSAKHWKSKGVFSRNYWQNEEATKEEIRVFINKVQAD